MSPASSDRHLLIGLDIGSTTSSLLIASAQVRRHVVSGRMGLEDVQISYRPAPIFTPFDNKDIDADKLGRQLDEWLEDSGIRLVDLFAGAALFTGLAAQSRNAEACLRLVEARVGEAIVATADDPCLESWLAFVGGSAALSRALADRPVLQLDIGGGTTNPALGVAGNVLATGCLDVGARHFRFVPGSYCLTGLSSRGRELLGHLGIEGVPGDTLAPAAIEQVISFYVQALEAVVRPDPSFFQQPCARRHMQVPLVLPADIRDDVIITFSGGVGELIYAAASGDALPGVTAFGDLGIELARAIVASPILSRSLHSHVPAQRGRATVYGLTLHSTEISGATLFVPRPELLPLRDLPVVARLLPSATEERWRAAVALVMRSRKGGCLQLMAGCNGLEEVRALGQKLRAALEGCSFPPDRPVVLLVPDNQGKTIGSYVTDWGRLPISLLVIDEIAVPDPHFVHLGSPRDGLVPISFSKLGS